MKVPEKVLDRFYYIVYMPLDADGNPADFANTVEERYEIWDQNYESWNSLETLAEAIQECEGLNRQHYRYKRDNGR